MVHFTTMKISLITLVILPFLLLSSIFAQKYPELVQYYKDRQLTQLQTRLNELEKSDPDHKEVRFFKAYFWDNGEEAFTVYQELFNQSYSPLKNLIADKISDYYYARGFYVKAEEYKKIAFTLFPVKTKDEKKTVDNNQKKNVKNNQKSIYMIQVGAFGVIDNANDLAQSLKARKMSVEVVNRIVGGQTLYCVWVAGRADIQATEDLAREIKQKYNLSYRIIKP